MDKEKRELFKEAFEELREEHGCEVTIEVPGYMVEEGDKREFADVWTDITIEGYCTIDMEWNRKRAKYDYLMSDKSPEEWEKVPNPDYDPDVKRNEIPDFCKRHIEYNCLEHQCPHFAYSESCKDSDKIAKVHTLTEE